MSDDFEKPWLQIALKTYFWVGVVCGVSLLISIGNYLFTTSVLKEIRIERNQLQDDISEYRSIRYDLMKERQKAYEYYSSMLYIRDTMEKQITKNIKEDLEK